MEERIDLLCGYRPEAPIVQGKVAEIVIVFIVCLLHALFKVPHMYQLKFSQQLYKVGTIICMLKVRKLEHREV